MALNKVELQRKHTNSEFIEDFTELFTISEFYRKCVPSPQFRAPEKFTAAVALTPIGRSRADALTARFKVSEADAILTMLLFPAHSEIEIDLGQTDFPALWAQLSADLIGGCIKFPFVYGRHLYDRFFEMFPSVTDGLSQDETARLLQGTPSGVFQIGNRVIGPFGVLLSAEARSLHPVATAPLWHCSDPSCNAIHPVKFYNLLAQTSIGATALKIIRGAEGPGSDWRGFYLQVVDPYAWYDHMCPASLPWLVSNGFTIEEQRVILAELLGSSNIRGVFPQNRRFQDITNGSNSLIASRMTCDYILQALLLASDAQLVAAIESVVSASKVIIPATEIRSSPVEHRRGGWFNCKGECSRLGVRFRSSRPGFDLRNLRATVLEVYGTAEGSEELAWKVRKCRGEDALGQLDEYLRDHEPRATVQDMFLDSRAHLNRLFTSLRFGRFEFPGSSEEEQALISKIVWKLGFRPRVYPKTHERFGFHLHAMRAALTEGSGGHVEGNERIRSVGVNLFVALEEILDYSLAVAGWALLADHYLAQPFTFKLDQARALIADKLNRSSANKAGVLFDAEGKNTLYALTSGFGLLAGEIRALLGREDQFIRDEKPGHHVSMVDPFPLRHTIAMFDFHPGDVSKAMETMEWVTHELSAANILSVRNRIDHQRQDFPQPTELRDACDNLERVVRQLEKCGLFPPPSIDVGSHFDEFGRGLKRYQDYAGRIMSLPVPAFFSILPIVSGPMILLSGLRFVGSSEILRLRLAETSIYTRLWAGYPRRRLRARAAMIEDGDSHADLTPASEAEAARSSGPPTALAPDEQLKRAE